MAARSSNSAAVFSVLHFLEQNNYQEAARTLERESGLFFKMNYFAECFIYGAFEEAEEYISGFTRVHDNFCSTQIIYEIRWHKFLEALHNNERDDAHSMLDEFRDFERYNPNLLPQMTELIDLPDFRTSEAFRDYGDPEEERRTAWVNVIKGHLENNPLFFGKLSYQAENQTFPPSQVVIGLRGSTNLRIIPSCFPRSRRI